jgi:hypothetical protein
MSPNKKFLKKMEPNSSLVLKLYILIPSWKGFFCAMRYLLGSNGKDFDRVIFIPPAEFAHIFFYL